jgi:hypothetical protein
MSLNGFCVWWMVLFMLDVIKLKMSAPIGLFVHPDSLYVGIGTTLPRTQLNLTSSGTGANATILTVGGGEPVRR